MWRKDRVSIGREWILEHTPSATMISRLKRQAKEKLHSSGRTVTFQEGVKPTADTICPSLPSKDDSEKKIEASENQNKTEKKESENRNHLTWPTKQHSATNARRRVSFSFHFRFSNTKCTIVFRWEGTSRILTTWYIGECVLKWMMLGRC